MEWWQSFAGAGAFACFIAILRFLRPKDITQLAQDIDHNGGLVMAGRTGLALAFQFVLWGVILGTPVWFVYRLIFD